MQKPTIPSFRDSLKFYKNIWNLFFSFIFLVGATHAGKIQAQDENLDALSKIEKACSSENLLSSIEKELVHCIPFLIQQGADVNVSNDNGATPLHLATMEGHKEVVALLIEKGADVTVSNENGTTPLHFAAWDSEREIAAILIENGADINVRNKRGNTPFHWATGKGDREIFNFLLDQGAEIDVRTIVVLFRREL